MEESIICQNWTVRTNMRRDTRLSVGFSRKLANHETALALKRFVDDFIPIHRTLRTSPAMAVGYLLVGWCRVG